MLKLSKELFIQEYIVKIEPMERIGEVFSKNKLNLIHGVQGSGKSFSTIKCLNADGITPIHINLDDSTGLEELSTYNVRDSFMIDFLGCKLEKSDMKGFVVIIDTYTRFEAEIFARGIITEHIGLFNLIESTIDFYDNEVTVIMIGHTAPFVGRDGIFNDNTFLDRGCAEELWLEKSTFKATKASPARTEYNLHVQKGRGFSGDRIINNWMR